MHKHAIRILVLLLLMSWTIATLPAQKIITEDEQTWLAFLNQNRLFLGLVYQNTAHSQLHLGYMNVFQQLAAGNRFREQHAIRLFYFHNFDFRKSVENH